MSTITAAVGGRELAEVVSPEREDTAQDEGLQDARLQRESRLRLQGRPRSRRIYCLSFLKEANKKIGQPMESKPIKAFLCSSFI